MTEWKSTILLSTYSHILTKVSKCSTYCSNVHEMTCAYNKHLFPPTHTYTFLVNLSVIQCVYCFSFWRSKSSEKERGTEKNLLFSRPTIRATSVIATACMSVYRIGCPYSWSVENTLLSNLFTILLTYRT